MFMIKKPDKARKIRLNIIQPSHSPIIGNTTESLEKNCGYGYAGYMSLSTRNLVFKLGIVFSFLCLLLGIAASTRIIPVYALMEAATTRRPEGFLQAFIGKFTDVKLLAAHFGIMASVLYSLLSIIFIHYSFEKTQSPEIPFVAFFAVSFSLEALRLILPLKWVYEIPSLYVLAASRIILFGRYFGIFSLFTASVYATGFRVQKQRNVITIITVTTLIIVLGFPIDTQTWDSSLNMINGYFSVLRLIEVGAFLIAIISFFIAAWSRSSREFMLIGVGVIFAFLGRNILLNADAWEALPLGLLFLVTGTWLICTKLHKVYLWL